MLKFVLLFIILPNFARFENVPSKNLIINLSTGRVEGHLRRTQLGNEAYVFLGVPYAEPPIDDLRFKITVAKKSWSTIWSCHDYKPVCPQNFGMHTYDNQNEDCLYLNIFVGENCLKSSEIGSTEKCPIFFMVHGGANEFETPNVFPLDEPIDRFASKNVIFVTIAYRIGILGFWTMGDQLNSGNWGLYDIIEGARWLQKEAINFGGDKNRVTISGVSSSGALILLLLMSPKTEGLFQQALVMSSTGDQGNMMSQNSTFYRRVAENVGCWTPADDGWDWRSKSKPLGFRSVEDCMRQIPASILVDTYNEVRVYDPTVDKAGFPDNATLPRYDGPDGLFPKPYEQLIYEKRQPIPMIIGTTSDENGYEKLTLLNATPRTVIQKCQSTVKNSSYVNKREIIEACVEYYVNHTAPYAKDAGSVFPYWDRRTVEITGDHEYYSLTFQHAYSVAETGCPVFLYSFDFERRGQEGIGIIHAQDFGMLFNIHTENLTADDRRMADQYSEFFVNFIKNGNPAPKIWKSLSLGDSFNYFSINLDNSHMKDDYHKWGVLFWNIRIPALEGKARNLLAGIESRKIVESSSNSINRNNCHQETSTKYVLIVLITLLCAVVFVLKFTVYPRLAKIERRFEYEQIH
uniref:Carboxylesterase type B domain-containing protein n=1 Tax=Romanomermis culicivorax TaxID=13658 RepID=A0A915KAA7_ROMCU